MDSLTADILTFLAFGIVWLFPIALVIAVLGASNIDAKSREEDLGPNVVQFPERRVVSSSKRASIFDRIKRLAIPAQGR